MDFIRFITGSVNVHLTAADIPAVLDAAAAADIQLYDTEFVNEFCISVWIRKKQWPQMEKLCRQKGIGIHRKRRMGLYWTLRALGNRPVLLLGAVLLTAYLLFLPSRILFVSVEGNQSVPDARILECAARFGLRFGADRRSLRSEQLKNQLLDEIPELRWAGVNTRGCVAVISVSEQPETPLPGEQTGICSIVASRDGVIRSATATAGGLQCREGQAVEKGQVLISGYTDCGLCIRGDRAQGEIFAQTSRELTVRTPAECRKRGGEFHQEKTVSIIFGKKRINLWKDSGISDAVCDRMYEEYYITLPGGFCLPVGIAVETYRFFADSPFPVEEAVIRSVLTYGAEECLRQDMVAGSIESRSEAVTDCGGFWILNGQYVCVEMIGTERQEEIGEYNGQDSGTDRQR